MNSPISGLPKPVFTDPLPSPKRKATEPLIVESPLSKGNLESRKKMRRLSSSSLSSLSLFSDKKLYGTDLNSLSKIYKIDFNHPPVHGNAHEFFARATLLMEIECCLKKHIFSLNLEPVREKLTSLLTSTHTHQGKMGELGTFLYLLDRDKELPSLEISSYITFRAGEICKEANELISQHQDTEHFDEERLIPSGKTHYLLRTFAKMILTSDQKFNIGSLHALIFILEYVELGVVRYLKPEHHAHILCMLKQMSTNTSFKGLIEREIHVHPDLAPFIRLDLKLAKEVDIPSVAVIWDCIMALLFDIRQHNDPNCYAVSALIYAVENGAFKVLERTIEWLTEGHFAFSDTVTIPISPLAEKRLVYEKELTEIEMPSAEAAELTTFQNIASTLNLSSSSYLDSTERSLNETLSDLLKENKVKEELAYAQKLFYSYKHNTLVHILLALIEFYCTNSSKKENSSSPFSKRKNAFLNTIFSLLPTSISTDYLKKFKEALGEKIWLHNCSEKEITIKKGKIQVGPTHNQREIKFSGDLKSLSKVLSESRRIYFLDEGKYRIIETFTDLQKSVVKVAEEIEIKNSTSMAVKALNSRPFLNAVANFCASELETSKISGKCLRKANLLVLIQTGGHGFVPLRKLFGLNFKIINFTAHNASQFLSNLYSTFKKCDSEMVAKTRVFYVQTEKHAFTLTPNYLSLLWNSEKNFQNWIQKKIYSRAIALQQRSIPKEKQKAIIEEFTGEESVLKNEITKFFNSQRNLTYSKFREIFLSKIISIKKQKKFLMIFDAEVMKVELNTDSLACFLRNLNIAFDAHLFNQFNKSVNERLVNSEPPFLIARTLHKTLIDEHIGIFSPFQIEKALCDIFDLPVPIDIGDLNWLDTNREDPVHCRVVIRYHSGYQSLCFFNRDKEDENMGKERLYRHFQIIHPHVGLVK